METKHLHKIIKPPGSSPFLKTCCSGDDSAAVWLDSLTLPCDCDNPIRFKCKDSQNCTLSVNTLCQRLEFCTIFIYFFAQTGFSHAYLFYRCTEVDLHLQTGIIWECHLPQSPNLMGHDFELIFSGLKEHLNLNTKPDPLKEQIRMQTFEFVLYKWQDESAVTISGCFGKMWKAPLENHELTC